MARLGRSQPFKPRVGTLISAGAVVSAVITAAAGTASNATLAGSSVAVASITAASGVAANSTLAGVTFVVASITAASGTATDSTLTGVAASGSIITAAAGTASSSALTGSSVAVAAISAAAGAATANSLIGRDANAVAVISKLAGWYYTPGNLPSDAPQWLRSELRNIGDASRGAAPMVQLQPRSSEPEKPRVGQVAYADGITWFAGSEGVYVYKTTGWKLIA